LEGGKACSQGKNTNKRHKNIGGKAWGRVEQEKERSLVQNEWERILEIASRSDPVYIRWGRNCPMAQG
jgi:hypothetical protein